MMRYPLLATAALALFAGTANCQSTQQMRPEETEVWEPEPAVVAADPHFTPPPEDAIVLFDGSGLEEWVSLRGGAAEWDLENGAVTVRAGSGDIKTRRNFGDIQLHIEWRAPSVIEGKGQGRGNSGIFLQERYEVQVLDNWENPTYVNGMAGSIYKQHVPLANPARRPGEWQSYDIFYKAPRFTPDGNLESPARITVLLNGILIQNNVEIFGETAFIGRPEYTPHGKAGVRLQDHSNPVSFRNIWVRELDEDIAGTDGIGLGSP